MKNFVQEFRTFAMRGNVVDLAVGVVIGAAFTQITTALANDILTPLIGLLGKTDFAHLAVELTPTAVVKYGALIQASLNFILTAFALFLIVKGINLLHKKKAAAPPTPAESEELRVLKEIRDELKRHE